jgi:hypothetical protein
VVKKKKDGERLTVKPSCKQTFEIHSGRVSTVMIDGEGGKETNRLEFCGKFHRDHVDGGLRDCVYGKGGQHSR